MTPEVRAAHAQHAHDLDWHAWRSEGVGGSDIAALLGLSNYGTPFTVWADKVGLTEPSPSTQRQRIGHRMEAVLAAEFHDETGLYVAGEQTWCEQTGARHRRCTVDGFVIDSYDPDDGDVSHLGTWQAKTDGRYGWPDGPPPNIRAQCVWEMGVTALPHCWLTVMFAGFRIQTFEIPWDNAAQADWALMCERADRFWWDHVCTGTPPPVDGSDATTEALRNMWPKHTEEATAELDGLADVLTERADLKEAIKADKARLTELDNRLRLALGDAEVGTVAGIPIVTYRSHLRAAYTVPESTVRTLRTAPPPKHQRKDPT